MTTVPDVVWVQPPEAGPLGGARTGPVPLLPGYDRDDLTTPPPTGVDLHPCPAPHAARTDDHPWVVIDNGLRTVYTCPGGTP